MEVKAPYSPRGVPVVTGGMGEFISRCSRHTQEPTLNFAAFGVSGANKEVILGGILFIHNKEKDCYPALK
ncbi:MAG: hypothetical protein HY667_07200 [Chloroflexi bacterium]|nr:hypothetical protein [Chloroflexota bacterium]